MKKLFLMGLLGAIILTGEVHAQLQKGTKYWGATIDFTGQHVKPTEGSSTVRAGQFNVNPSLQFGKFVKDNRMLGLGLGTQLNFYSDLSKNPGGDEFKTTSVQGTHELSLFARQYKTLGPKWAIFLHSAVRGAWLTSKIKSNVDTNKEGGYLAGIRIVPGLAYWISPRFSIETDVNFLSLGAAYTDFRDIDTFQFQSSVTTGLGSYFSVRAAWYLQKP